MPHKIRELSQRRALTFDPVILLVGILTLAGLALRFWKIHYGLPDVTFANEEITCYPSLNLGGQGFNPRHFIHPNLYYYLWFFLDAIFILGSLATGHFKSTSDAWLLYKTNPTVYFVMGRSISALLGTLTIPLTYEIGRKFFGKKGGLGGAFFLTVSLVHVQWSQIAYMDAPLTFFVMLTFVFALAALETGRVRDFVLAGLFGGLSTSTKYHGAPTLLWGPLACFLCQEKSAKNLLASFWDRRVLLFFCFFIFGFTLGTPFWILDFPEFKKQFLMMCGWFRPRGQGHVGIEGDWNWGYYLFTTLPYSVGLPVLASSLLGILLLIRQISRRNFYFLSFPAAYFFIAGFTKIRQAKYVMPVFPFLCLAAGFFLVFTIEKWLARKNRSAGTALFLATLLVGLPSLTSTLRYNYLKGFPDTRQLAIEWMDAHVPPESSLLGSSNIWWHRVPRGPKMVDLDPGLIDQRLENRTSLKSLEEYRKEGFDYIVLDEWHLGLLLGEEAGNPKYQAAIERYRKFLEDLRQSARRVALFSPYRGESPPFDRENANYASRALWRIKRFGPAIEIYKL